MLRAIWTGILWCWCCSTALANTPDQLANWEQWISDRHPSLNCPRLASQPEVRQCIWPGKLFVAVSQTSATFAYLVSVYQDTTVALPGDEFHWPSEVLDNNQAAIIVENNKRPAIFLKRGQHTLTGKINWRAVPAQLGIPEQIAQIELLVNGQPEAATTLNNKLILTTSKSTASLSAQDHISLEVYRKIIDAIPLKIETHLQVSVSGKPREIELGLFLPAQSQTISFDSPLPARIEDSGNLRLQVRPGKFSINLISQFTEPQSHFSMRSATAEWPEYEIWAFDANPGLRTTNISGAVAVDTSQVNVPSPWKNLPTYKITPNSQLTIKTKSRGDHTPHQNSLDIRRELWLDFDGKGYTVKDDIQGAMYQDWRLNSATDVQIGRASVAGQPVLITEIAQQSGIEIRSPDIQLEAVSRIADRSAFSATGWQSEANTLNATLHVPPGWRVLNVHGADRANYSWVSRWSLWNVFLCFLIVAACWKVLGWQSGILATAFVFLAYHESGAPIGIWLYLIGLVALIPVVTHAAFKRIINMLSLAGIAALVLITVGFAVSQFRLAMYPQLEQHSINLYESGRGDFAQISSAPKTMVMESTAHFDGIESDLEEAYVADQYRSKTSKRKQRNLYAVDENDVIQTGPGLPKWRWHQLSMHWSGPVSHAQQVSIAYSPPWLTRIWRILTVILAAMLALMVLKRMFQIRKLSGNSSGVSSNPAGGIPVAAIAAVLLVWGNLDQSAMASDFPPEYLLKEFEQRLLKAPDCTPNCVAFNAGRIAVHAADKTSQTDQFTLEFSVTVAADLAVPLPSVFGAIIIDSIVIDQQTANTLRTNEAGFIEAYLSTGEHQIMMQGRPTGEAFSVRFPMAMHNLTSHISGWKQRGFVDGRVPGGTVEFNAIDKKTDHSEKLTPDPIAPFVLVSRTLVLGKRWELETTITRVAPADAPMNIGVPLWPNEQILNEQIKVVENVAQVYFQQNQNRVSWLSDIAPVSELTLRAPVSDQLVETWRVIPGSLWNLQHEGLTPVKQSHSGSGLLQPLWQPWPGEQLQLRISRPAGIAGPTQTIESAILSHVPGKRLEKTSLALSIRASQGTEFKFALPDNARALSLSVDGQALNLPSGNLVVAALKPGLQDLQVEWQQEQAISWWSTSPAITLPVAAANLSIHYDIPHDRWPLLVGGPPIGPAMLYWGVLFVICIGAFILVRIQKSLSITLPLGIASWLLLGVGLSTTISYGVLPIVLWFFALAWRQQQAERNESGENKWQRWQFNGVQILLLGLSCITLFTLMAAIQQGLLSSPDMKIVGNQSTSRVLNWFQDDAVSGELPTGYLLSAPLLVYRLVMLLWAGWIAFQIIKWSVWGWRAISSNGFWMSKASQPDNQQTNQQKTNKQGNRQTLETNGKG